MRGVVATAVRCLALAAAALLCAAGMNALRPKPLPWQADWSAHIEERARKAGIGLASVHQVRAAISAGAALLVDAREAGRFRAGRIAGAVSLPLATARERLMAAPVADDPDRPMIVYCGGLDCEDALELALLLRRFGYRQVSLFAGGWAEWRAAGGATEAGP